MRILSIFLGTFLFGAAQVCGYGTCEVKAQTSVKAINKEEPKTVKIKITGMTCAGCSNHVAKTLKELDGVLEQKIEYPGDVATVKYNPAKISVADTVKAVEKLGYKAVTVKEKSAANQG